MTNFTRVFQPIPSWLNWPIILNEPDLQQHRLTNTIHLTLKMTSAQVVETSVTNNSSFQNYTHPDDHTIQTTDTPGFKPFTMLCIICQKEKNENLVEKPSSYEKVFMYQRTDPDNKLPDLNFDTADQSPSLRELKMTSAQVVEMSVTNNSSFQNYTHPDDHTIRTTDDILIEV